MLDKPVKSLTQVPNNAGKTLVCRTNIGTAMRISQNVSLLCRRLSSTEPGLALIHAGHKILHHAGQETVIPAGSAVLFNSGTEVDIINEVDVEGFYRADVIYFNIAMLPAVAPDNTKQVSTVQALPGFAKGLHDAMNGTIAAMADAELPDAVVAHRLRELLLWVEARGFAIVKPRTQDVIAQVRNLIIADPSTEWQTAQIAERLAMSEATLRRKVAKTGTTLTEIALDVRMTAALVMLQSTDTSVTEVSFAVGYDSPSRFAMRFRKRFGFAPSQLRNPAPLLSVSG